jgi:hypothetical protein
MGELEPQRTLVRLSSRLVVFYFFFFSFASSLPPALTPSSVASLSTAVRVLISCEGGWRGGQVLEDVRTNSMKERQLLLSREAPFPAHVAGSEPALQAPRERLWREWLFLSFVLSFPLFPHVSVYVSVSVSVSVAFSLCSRALRQAHSCPQPQRRLARSLASPSRSACPCISVSFTLPLSMRARVCVCGCVWVCVASTRMRTKQNYCFHATPRMKYSTVPMSSGSRNFELPPRRPAAGAAFPGRVFAVSQQRVSQALQNFEDDYEIKEMLGEGGYGQVRF